jgi:hypothetical protein
MLAQVADWRELILVRVCVCERERERLTDLLLN